MSTPLEKVNGFMFVFVGVCWIRVGVSDSGSGDFAFVVVVVMGVLLMLLLVLLVLAITSMPLTSNSQKRPPKILPFTYGVLITSYGYSQNLLLLLIAHAHDTFFLKK